MPAFSLDSAPRLVSTAASLHYRRSSTAPTCVEAHSFGSGLEPRYIVRAEPLDQ
jgi:hypothetical protein